MACGPRSTRHVPHGFVPGAEPDGAPALHAIDILGGTWVEHAIAPGQAVNDAIREVFDAACTPLSQPSHRLLVLEFADGPVVIVGSDHMHVDMWSFLVVLRDMTEALEAVRLGEALFAGVDPPPPFAQHTVALTQRPPAPTDVREKWRTTLEAFGGQMPTFPLDLGTRGQPQPERVEIRDVLDIGGIDLFEERAEEVGVSTLALAVSSMTQVTLDVAGAPLRALFPVHSRYDETWHDSVGWFITNSVIHVDDPDPLACKAAVKEAIALGSWPLADVLAPWGGMPDTPEMFAVSWVDLRHLPVKVDTDAVVAHLISSVIRPHDVMLWFVLNETGLHLRCRYPDTPEARTHLGTWLDALVAHLRDVIGAGAQTR